MPQDGSPDETVSLPRKIPTGSRPRSIPAWRIPPGSTTTYWADASSKHTLTERAECGPDVRGLSGEVPAGGTRRLSWRSVGCEMKP
jgi:hypothetical protein